MPKENQRVAISKRLLKEGITKLLSQKHIDEISVVELCAVSGINRTTFYRHYQTLHDVVMEMELEFVKSFYAVPVSPDEAKDVKKIAARMCAFLYEHRTLIKLFIENNTDSDITLIFQNFSDGFLASRSILYKGQTISDDTLKLMQTFFAYGGYALVRKWIVEDISLTPEEIAELILGSFNQNFTFK